MFLQVHPTNKRRENQPSICEDDISFPNFGDGILADLSRCESDTRFDELVYLVDNYTFGLCFRRRRR